MKLEQVFKKQSLSREEDEEIPNNEEVNKIISRSEEEFELFQRLDAQRMEEERKYYKNVSEEFNYRLLQYEEIPDFIKELENPVKKENVISKRLRPNLEHLVEDSDDSVSYKKKKKVSKKRSPQQK